MKRDFDVGKKLAEWELTLLPGLDIGGLFQRNPTAHKWKALYRSLTLRECAFWRVQDLLAQSFALHQQEHGIGARILLRGGLETLAMLIRLNQHMADVLDGKLDFHRFSENTLSLLLGSKNGQTTIESVNIITILNHCDKRYPGIKDIYAELCETAHPNFEGLCIGYSKIDHRKFKTTFSNRWKEMYGDKHLDLMRLCMSSFEFEYDKIWPERFEKMERWVETNDVELEATKPPDHYP